DRLSEQIRWDCKSLTLLDTAGFQTDHPAPNEEFVLEQIESMIDQGQCFVFVVDAQEGVTELDRKIAKKLHGVDEDVILVANKADPPADPHSLKSAFYELGFENVIAVSALHEKNIDTVKDLIRNYVPDANQPVQPFNDGISISLVGRPNVGKSTLFNAILGYDRVMVSEEPGTTRDFIDVTFDVEQTTFNLMDTGGMIQESSVESGVDQDIIYGSLRAINFSDVVCLMLDWNKRVSKQDQRIAGLIQDRYRGCILLVNKADEIDEENEENWLNHLRDRLYFLDYAPVLFTSGRTHRGLGAIFRTASDVYNQMNKTFEPETLTNTFLDLKSRLSWPSGEASDVILQNIEQTDTNPVTLDVTARNPELLGQNDLRYLRRTLRDHLDLDICPLKLRVDNDDDTT
ncbi:MAG: ribosome biogenesis GTPase Der, partial [bacterium]